VTTLADFSQLTVQEVKRQTDCFLLSGRITKPGRLSSGEDLGIHVTSDKYEIAKLMHLDPDAGTGTLKVMGNEMHASIVEGATFALCSEYWSDKLNLVLDKNLRWNRITFAALDAFVEPAETPGWRKWSAATPEDKNRTDGKIAPGGWDHEHCEICWTHIDPGDDGYKNEPNNWVCVKCFERYVAPHDLRFALERASDDWDDEGAPHLAFRQISKLIDEYDLVALRKHLEERGDVNARSKYGWTPLMLASSRGHVSLVSLLMEEGADVNAVSEQHGYTALALAAQKGYRQIVEMLLKAGASARVPERILGGSLIKYVKSGPGRNDAMLLELLTKAGAK
jgi:hypothetical protein